MEYNLSYVYSAPNLLRVMQTKFEKTCPDEFARYHVAVMEGLSRIREVCRRKMNDDTLRLSILYNAYTEADRGAYLNARQRYGFDDIYADSGGLQAVTTGKILTSELKEEVYRRQRDADYGFCFDEIPLGLKEGASEKAKHRSQTDFKIFYPEGFDRCARNTAQNILDQAHAFEGSNTRAFYILQGNTQQEMYRWFETGVEVIGKDGFKYIQGIAPADTCMGNGTLESIDMLVAYHRILNDFGPDYGKHHLHLLGVGSPIRMLPAMFMKMSGFLPDDMQFSFDSSTASMSYVMGNFADEDGSNTYRVPKRIERVFKNFYRHMGDILEAADPTCTEESFLAHLMNHFKSTADTINLAPPDCALAVRITVTLICLWQSIGFFTSLKELMECDETRQSGVGYLAEVKTMDDYRHWTQIFGHHIKSKRIDRKQTFTLDDMFV